MARMNERREVSAGPMLSLRVALGLSLRVALGLLIWGALMRPLILAASSEVVLQCHVGSYTHMYTYNSLLPTNYGM